MGVAKVWDGTRWLRVLPKVWDNVNTKWVDHPVLYTDGVGTSNSFYGQEQKNVNLQSGTRTNLDGVNIGTTHDMSAWFTFKTDGTITRTTTGCSEGNVTDQAVNNSTDWCTPRPFDLAKGDFYIRFSAGSPSGTLGANGSLIHTENVWYDLHDNPSIICGINYDGGDGIATKGIKVEIAEYILVSDVGTMNVLGEYNGYFITLEGQ